MRISNTETPETIVKIKHCIKLKKNTITPTLCINCNKVVNWGWLPCSIGCSLEITRTVSLKIWSWYSSYFNLIFSSWCMFEAHMAQHRILVSYIYHTGKTRKLRKFSRLIFLFVFNLFNTISHTSKNCIWLKFSFFDPEKNVCKKTNQQRKKRLTKLVFCNC